ncbi:MAG: methyltransferase [Promethearchaeota archaeon]
MEEKCSDGLKTTILDELSGIEIAPEGTHHLKGGKPLYTHRFNEVLSFHVVQETGTALAPVKDESGAYHINLLGEPAYTERFERTFGFYFGRAAVVTRDGWFHVLADGARAYDGFHDWVGNYQDALCVVRDSDWLYYHIDKDGDPVYEQRYLYTGDFYHGKAAAIDIEGNAHHIDKEGCLVHEVRYEELNIFHKGFATGRDSRGWCHLDVKGIPIYKERYASVEPFYNGQALVKNFRGDLGILDETGNWQHTIRDSQKVTEGTSNLGDTMKLVQEIQWDLTAYWHTQTIHAAVELGIFQAIGLSGKTAGRIIKELSIDEDGGKRLLLALKIKGYIHWDEKTNDSVELTSKGKLMLQGSRLNFRDPAILWGGEHYLVWAELSKAVKSGKEQFSALYGDPFFPWLEENPEILRVYRNSMSLYAALDYPPVASAVDFSKHKTIMDVGGGEGFLLRSIIRKYPSVHGIILDLPNCTKESEKKRRERVDRGGAEVERDGVINPRITFLAGDFFKSVPKGADAIILSRVLHDWPDEVARVILQNCYESLPDVGAIYLVEIVRPTNPERDFGVLLNLNMLVVTGGKERTRGEFRALLQESGFQAIQFIPVGTLLNLIVGRKNISAQ